MHLPRIEYLLDMMEASAKELRSTLGKTLNHAPYSQTPVWKSTLCGRRLRQDSLTLV
jgi:hypothetical protein